MNNLAEDIEKVVALEFPRYGSSLVNFSFHIIIDQTANIGYLFQSFRKIKLNETHFVVLEVPTKDTNDKARPYLVMGLCESAEFRKI